MVGALLLVGVLGAVRYAQIPPEPVYQDKPLSWWLTKGGRLDAEQLRSLGPGAVTWLSYQAGQARLWNPNYIPSDTPLHARIFLRVHHLMHKDPFTEADKVHYEAIGALEDLGPHAAPAVAGLVKATRNGCNDERLIASQALAAIGPPSWPAVWEAIQHGTKTQRSYLLDEFRFSKVAPSVSPADFAKAIDILLVAARDPCPEIRKFAQYDLKQCAEAREGSAELRAGIRKHAEKMTDLRDEEQRFLAGAFAALELHASAATPKLAELVETTSDPLTRVQFLRALVVTDPDNPRWSKRLYEVVASPNRDLARFAEDALTYARRFPDSPVISK